MFVNAKGKPKAKNKPLTIAPDNTAIFSTGRGGVFDSPNWRDIRLEMQPPYVALGLGLGLASYEVELTDNGHRRAALIWPKIMEGVGLALH